MANETTTYGRTRDARQPAGASNGAKQHASPPRPTPLYSGQPVSSNDDRPITQWPTIPLTPQGNCSQTDTHPTPEQKTKKAPKGEESKTIESPNDHSRPLRDANEKKPERQNTGRKPKRQPRLPGRSKEQGKKKQHQENSPPRLFSLAKLKCFRKGIWDGCMERAVPPNKGRRARQRPVPAVPPPRHQFLDLKPSRALPDAKTPSKPDRKQDRSSTGAIGAGGHVDESKFRPPFEHISLPRRNTDSALSTTSVTHFEADYRPRIRAACLELGTGYPMRRMSGEGRCPWGAGPLPPCRLCGKADAGAVRGLCGACEMEYTRPDTLREYGAGTEIPPRLGGEEIGPTPLLLEDMNLLSLGGSGVGDESAPRLDDVWEAPEGEERTVVRLVALENGEYDDEPPGGLDESIGKLVKIDTKFPTTIHPLQRQISQTAQIEFEGEGVDGSQNDSLAGSWTSELGASEMLALCPYIQSNQNENANVDTKSRTSLAGTQTTASSEREMFEWWTKHQRENPPEASEQYGGDKDGARMKGEGKRHTSFYNFWDSILVHHGAERLSKQPRDE